MNFKDGISYNDSYIFNQRVYSVLDKHARRLGKLQYVTQLGKITFKTNKPGLTNYQNRFIYLKEQISKKKLKNKPFNHLNKLISYYEYSTALHELESHGRELNERKCFQYSIDLQRDAYTNPVLYLNNPKKFIKENIIANFNGLLFSSEMIALINQKKWLEQAGRGGVIDKITTDYLISQIEVLRNEIYCRKNNCKFYCEYCHSISLIIYDKLIEKFGKRNIKNIFELPNQLIGLNSKDYFDYMSFSPDLILLALLDKDIKNDDINNIGKQAGEKVLSQYLPNDIHYDIDEVRIAKNHKTIRELIFNRVDYENTGHFHEELFKILGSTFGISFSYEDKEETKENGYIIWGNIHNSKSFMRELARNLFQFRYNFFDIIKIDERYLCQSKKRCPILSYLEGDLSFFDFYKTYRFKQRIDYTEAKELLENSLNNIVDKLRKCYNSQEYKNQSLKNITKVKNLVNNSDLFYSL